MHDPPQNDVAIQFNNVAFQLEGGRVLIEGLDFSVRRGETLVLLGKSGSGKTTSLKLINRLLPLTSGEIRVEGCSIREWNVIRLRRRIGYVIQEVGLFPHFSVERNIGLVPTIEKWDEGRIRERVRELLSLVGLDSDFAGRFPRELSGGQRQRVGVARALAADPPILLMDEPFGALDPITRAELQREFLALQQRLKKTVVFVTHDLREALLLADRIALMEEGKLLATLTAEEFVRSKDSLIAAYVAAFATDMSALAKRGDS